MRHCLPASISASCFLLAVPADLPRRPVRGLDQIQFAQALNGRVPFLLAQADQRFRQARQRGRLAQRRQAVGRRRPVEQAQQPQDGQFDLPALALEPPLVRREDAEGVAVLRLGVGGLEAKAVAAGDVRRKNASFRYRPISDSVSACPWTSRLARRNSSSGPATPCARNTAAPATSER